MKKWIKRNWIVLILIVLDFFEMILNHSEKIKKVLLFIAWSGIILLVGFNIGLLKGEENMAGKINRNNAIIKNLQEQPVEWAIIYCRSILGESDLNECWIKQQKLNNQMKGKKNENY